MLQMCRETDLSLRDRSSKDQQEIEELREFFDKLTVELKQISTVR